MSELSDTILTRRQAASDYLSTKRPLWDEYENIFFGVLDDTISLKAKSQVFDPVLPTLAIERSNRVMAQLPTGKVKGMSKNDEAGEKLMNMTLDKYVMPNANSQFDFLTKMRMVDLYANMYGNFFSLVDWNVNKNGYTGPDIWLLNIRDVFPQVGAVSLDDSDYVIVRTWKPISYFKSLKAQSGYKNLGKIITRLEKLAGDKSDRDSDNKSTRESEQYPSEDEANKKGYFEVLSMYERDRWVSFVPNCTNDGVFRDGDNPHDNGELPVLCKYAIPLLDDFMGMGDFERGKTMQYANNSLWNLYLDAVKISVFPPTLINKDSIASASSIKFGPAAKWLMRGDLSNAAQVLNLTPQGISTFNNTRQAVLSSLYNMFGTTDTARTSEVDPGFGKTPEALKMQAARESTRDNADRFYMEQYLKKVMNRFCNLIAKNQTGAMTLRLFKPEVEELTQQYPEMAELYDEQSGKFTIPKKRFGNVLFDYELVSGSTYAVDQDKQQENLSNLLMIYLKNPQLIEGKFQQEGKAFMLGELITRIISNSGTQDWDKIIVDLNESGGNLEQIQSQAQQTLEQAIQQMQSGQPMMAGVPIAPGQQPPMMPQGAMGQMNQVPPMPNAQI